MQNIPFWKILASWIFPLKIESFDSNKNILLTVNLQYGQLVVYSPNANFSFGNLHYVFQEVIASLNLSLEKKHDILILGFGAGSISEILKNKNIKHKITGIEYDEAIIEIAKKYFPYVLIDSEIIFTDAYFFAKTAKSSYDVIFIDLFNDTFILEKFQTKEFLKNILSLTKPNSIIVMNSMTNAKKLFKSWNNVFKETNYISVQENKVLIFKK